MKIVEEPSNYGYVQLLLVYNTTQSYRFMYTCSPTVYSVDLKFIGSWSIHTVPL